MAGGLREPAVRCAVCCGLRIAPGSGQVGTRSDARLSAAPEVAGLRSRQNAGGCSDAKAVAGVVDGCAIHPPGAHTWAAPVWSRVWSSPYQAGDEATSIRASASRPTATEKAVDPDLLRHEVAMMPTITQPAKKSTIVIPFPILLADTRKGLRIR